VVLSDRESDIYEYLWEAERLEQKVVLRSAKDRGLFSDKHHERLRLWIHLKKIPSQGSYDILIPKSSNKPERRAVVDVRYANEILIMPPQRNPKAQERIMEPVAFNAVWIKESSPPDDEEGVEWMLLTNISIKSTDDAKKIAKWYCSRWHVENFHRVLKSGCKIKDCRLENFESLKKMIQLKSIIAYRLYSLYACLLIIGFMIKKKKKQKTIIFVKC
jgi:hypothetical protein